MYYQNPRSITLGGTFGSEPRKAGTSETGCALVACAPTPAFDRRTIAADLADFSKWLGVDLGE